MLGDIVIGNQDNLRQTISGALVNQSAKTVTVLSSLLAVEDAIGYIPPEAIQEVATFTNSTINDVWGVASFYTNFQFTVPGQHKVELCWGGPCHILGAMKVIEAVMDAVDLPQEGKSSDGKVSVHFNTCLGACANGPVMSIDHKLFGRLSPEKAREFVNELLERHG